MQIRTETIVGLFFLAALGVFFYMTFQIGVFRFDRKRYSPYSAFFSDISGLAKKSDIKIAGVKVGWIDDIKLVDQGKTVQTTLMILSDYALHNDAYAVIRQEGLLGNKHIEIVTGSPLNPRIPAGGTLSHQPQETAQVDDILRSFKKVAENVEDVSNSVKQAFGGSSGTAQLKNTVESFSTAASKIADASTALERLLMRNEENLNTIMTDVRDVIHDLRDRIPMLTDNLSHAADRLNSEFLPNLNHDLHRLADRLDGDFLPRVATSVEEAAVSLKNVADKATGSFTHFNAVAEKIDKGQGLLGKLINEDETYHDLRSTVRSIRSSLDKLDRLAIVVDGHVESMNSLVETSYSFRDAKGYANLRMHPVEDYFYVAGIAYSQRGFISRKTTQYRYYDEKNNEVLPSQLRKEEQIFDNFWRKEEIAEYRDAARVNLQFGKIFNDIALRVGLFEGSFGIGIDYDVPFESDNYRWVMTFEAFDMRGRNRFFNDQRPHVKWLNRMYVTPNLYFAFGADDFISKLNKTAFFGAGLRFEDDDLKYLIRGAGLGF